MNIKNVTTATAAIVLLTTACQPKSKTAETEENKVVEAAPEKAEQHDLEFERVKKVGVKDTLTFTLHKSDSVMMKLLLPPGKTGNIRINQLIAPNGGMDGPFGSDYSDSLKIPGTYKVIIAESLMQENPYEGPYKVQIMIGGTH